MKKNNKFRNNGNSNAFSLNYKFDSISPAGKCSGTALDLIKRYNELAKEAHGSGNYIEMEMFRQYAEHYRKIVTEINERKNIRAEQAENKTPAAETTAENVSETNAKSAPSLDNADINSEPQVQEPVASTDAPAMSEKNKPTLKLGKIASKKKTENNLTSTPEKKEFMVVEIMPKPEEINTSSAQSKPAARRRKTESAEAAAV